jgi:FHA domain-containing protein
LNAEPAPEAKLPDDFDLGLGPQPSGGQSIDSMFGLKPGNAGPSDLFAPGSALGEQTSRPNTAADADPFAALGLQQAAPQAPMRDQVPELHGSYVPPVARAASDAAVRATPAEPASRGAAPEAPAAHQPSREDPLLAMLGGEGGGMPGGADALGLGMPAEAPPQQRQPATPPLSPPMPPHAPAAQPTPPAGAAAASDDDLLYAFLKGLGAVSGLQIDRLTPQMMQLIGSLLRESVQGTLDLLLARAMTKREVRAEVTMIVGRENNPLKFSPNASAALPHLLGPPVRGFMTPEAAMRDAYDDLRAHTFGFMAGMRAALAGVLARFNPENLEKRLTEKSMLDSLLSMNRRAKLWDLFNDLYHDISQEAEEDFHNLFGREFLRAYEEQVARLHVQDNNK